MLVTQSRLQTPWGEWALEDDGHCIIGVHYWPQQDLFESPSPLAIEAQKQVNAYLQDASFQLDLPLKPSGTEFQQGVWQQLQQIPVGTVLTYGQVAKALGSVARAVGGACRANPIPFFVPCHRVVAAQGLGGFSGETDGKNIALKRALLAHEKVALD